MLRRMMLILPMLGLALMPLGAASEEPSQLGAALNLPKLAQILHREGLDYGASLEAEMFLGQGGARWAAEVARIHDPSRILAGLEAGLAPYFADTPKALDEAVAFFASDFGQRIIGLELSAREAMLDKDTTEAAELAFEALSAKGGDRLAALERFVQVNDLIASNVAGAMNSNLAFMQGMMDGGAMDQTMPEADMLADLWSQEDKITQDIENWVFPFVAMAYQPLDAADLAAYTAFCETPTGQRVNAALFDAFDKVFAAVSYDLGRAAAGFLTAQDI